MSARAPVKRSRADAPFEPLEVEGLAEVQTLLDGDNSESIGAGFARFRETSFEWKLSYDEVVHVLEGRIVIRCGEQEIAGSPGDVLLVPRGNTVTYAVADSCTLFFATYPVDWEDGSV